ncbi:MAG: hypothetical protein R3195_10665 [Gemmatimonadota bacterium]|nr:hypothetical protein [Gemmatimonadota bacterium]
MMRAHSKGRRVRCAAFAAVGAAVMLPVTAAPTQGQASTASTVYEREVFSYPSLGRRDPFRALNAGERIGPQFIDLRLSGVLFNPSIGSVATLLDESTGRRYRVREGEVLGDARVVAIRTDEVDFLITNYGISRQETLRVKRNKESEG